MKSLIWIGLAAILMWTGCASSPSRSMGRSSSVPTRLDMARDVAILMTNMMPVGTKRVFEFPYNRVWRAALDAAQQGDLEVLSADRARGYISVRNGARLDTTGENFGVSIRTLGPAGTEVEVVSRQAAVVGATFKDWENEIIRTIASNLTRGSAAVGGTGSGAQVFNEINIDRNGAALVPETPEARLDALRDAERLIGELRERQRAREAELQPETDEERRAKLKTEIDRLREELRKQEDRLREIGKDRR